MRKRTRRLVAFSGHPAYAGDQPERMKNAGITGDSRMKFGEKVQLLRRAQGLTQEGLAEALGGRGSRWQSGRRASRCPIRTSCPA